MAERSWFGVLRKVSFENRFYFLFFALILFIILEPVFAEKPVVLTTLASLLLLAAIDCLSFQKRNFLVSRWFGVVVLGMGWLAVGSRNVLIQTLYFSVRVIFLAFVSGVLIYQTAKSREVSPSVIAGAIDGYLLLGIIGAVAFSFTEYIAPGSIQSSSHSTGAGSMLYYSFVTMTTVGYGDFVPVSDTARTIAILLATTGQLYIAVLIALLVGKFASRT